MTARIRNPHYPWNVARLVQRCKTWNFDNDLDQFDKDDGEPYAARAMGILAGEWQSENERALNG